MAKRKTPAAKTAKTTKTAKTAKSETPAKHFVVSRLNWRPAGRLHLFVRVPGETRVATFPDANAAANRAAELEAAARTKVNPFQCGAVWADRASMPEPVYRDFLRDVGIDPPAKTDLAEW